MWPSPPAIRHARLRARRPGIGSACHALHATKCYVFRLFREFGKPGFRRKLLINNEHTPAHRRSAWAVRVPASHTELSKTLRTIPTYSVYDKIAGILRVSPEE